MSISVNLSGKYTKSYYGLYSTGEDINLEEEDELDEATRQFNFWTHQVHIFFVRKFFPASQRNLHLLRMIAENYTALPEAETAVFHLEALESESAAIPHDHTEYDASSHNEVAHSDIVEEQESTAESWRTLFFPSL